MVGVVMADQYADLVRRLQRYRFKTTDDAAAAIEALVAERDEARRFGEEAARRYNESLVLRCAFCNAEYPAGVPPTQHEALTAHVKECPRHPMRGVEAERDALRAELAQAVIERDNNQVSRDEWKAKYLATKALPVGGQLLKAMPVGWHGDTTNPRGDDSDPEGL